MEDNRSNDPDPSLLSSGLNDLDLPPFATATVSEIDGNGPGSASWYRIPDISLELTSDPWTPNFGWIQLPGHPSMFNSVDCTFGDCLHSHQIASVASDPNMESIPNDEASSFHFGLPNPEVRSLAHEQSRMSDLSFDSSGRSHHNLVMVGHPSHASIRPSTADNSLNESQRAGDAPLAANNGRRFCVSFLQDGARNYGTRDNHAALNLDAEPRTTDFSANAGEMFFDLNMDKVQPRRLKKKTFEERKSYLNVRRQGGACEKHKLAKRAVSTASCRLTKTLRFS
jgi:hypothetical protein